MRNNKITPSTNTSSVNPVVIGAATGGLIGMVVVITIICVIVGRQKRTEMNSLKRKYPAKPMDKSCHVYHNVTNINHCSTTHSDEYSMENANTDLETEIHRRDAAMNKEGILIDEVNNEYSYSNLLTNDTSKIKHHAENSYYDLSDNYNEVQEIQTVIKIPPKVKTDDSGYIDQGEAYNILNINPRKINDTENFDRTIEDVYDKTKYKTNNSYSDLGLYDLSSNN